jgi:hypothetical protein
MLLFNEQLLIVVFDFDLELLAAVDSLLVDEIIVYEALFICSIFLI